MQTPIKTCVVGLGRAGHFHLHSIERLPEMELHSVVDTNAELAEKVAVENDCKWSLSLNELLDDSELDAVIVASPTDAHYAYILASLEAGKHVFTEKPVGHSVEEIQACFQAAKEAGKALHLGFQRRFDTNFMELKNQLSELGDARIVKASSRDNPRPSYDYLRISGNIFHDMLIHDFDMLMFLFGAMQPESVHAVGHAYDETIASFNDHDTVLVTIKYPNGMVCSIDTSRISAYGYDQRIEVFGEKGMALVENERNHGVKLYTESGEAQSVFKHSFPQRYPQAYLNEIKNFVEGIQQGVLTNVAEAECVLAHQIADAALESITKGETVRFSEFTSQS